MTRRINERRFFSDISSVGELREVRRELDLRTWYAERRLSEDVRETFSMDGLLSIFAPPGSAGERVVGGAISGIATMRGIMNAIGAIRERGLGRRGKKGCGCGC